MVTNCPKKGPLRSPWWLWTARNRIPVRDHGFTRFGNPKIILIGSYQILSVDLDTDAMGPKLPKWFNCLPLGIRVAIATTYVPQRNRGEKKQGFGKRIVSYHDLLFLFHIHYADIDHDVMIYLYLPLESSWNLWNALQNGVFSADLLNHQPWCRFLPREAAAGLSRGSNIIGWAWSGILSQDWWVTSET